MESRSVRRRVSRFSVRVSSPSAGGPLLHPAAPLVIVKEDGPHVTVNPPLSAAADAAATPATVRTSLPETTTPDL